MLRLGHAIVAVVDNLEVIVGVIKHSFTSTLDLLRYPTLAMESTRSRKTSCKEYGAYYIPLATVTNHVMAFSLSLKAMQ